MKITSIEILPKLIIPTVPFVPTPPPPPPIVIGAEQHWYIGSIAINQESPGTTHESYLDAVNGVSGSKYISSVQDETLVVGQSFAHFTAPPASPYENDTWEVFESFIDFDTSNVTSPVDSLKLRLHVNIKQIQITQELLVAVYNWGGGAVDSSDWHSPTDLSALTPIGSYTIDDSTTFPSTIDIDLDPTSLVLAGHMRVILYTSQTKDGISPGGPGPTGFSHSFADDIFFEPAIGNYPALSPSLVYGFAPPPPPATPSITSVSPNSGSTAGGTSITITGTNFTGTTSVEIGGLSASFTIVSNTTIIATTPAHASGVVDIRVTNASGTSPTVTADHFTFVAPPPAVPTVTGVSPSSGTTDGGTLLTITGTGFVSVTDVTVGGTSVSFTVVNSTTITATTPSHAAGTVDVLVTNTSGTSSVVTADHFTYNVPAPSAPTVTSISPNSGTTAGGTGITIAGTNFTGATDVTIGGTSVSFTVVNSTTITATTPAHAAATVDVRVTNAGGTSPAVVGDHFTYVTPPPAAPTITGISPNSGSTTGGTSITITGTNFINVTNVTIAGISVSYTVVNSTTITATTPAHAAGVTDVRVTNVTGVSPIVTADQFTFTSTIILPSPIGPRAAITGPILSDTGLSSSYCGTHLTLDQEFQYLWDAGFHTAQDLQIGAAIALAESGHGGGPDIGCRNWHPEFGFRPLAESPVHLVAGLVPPAKAWNPAGNTSGQIMRSDRGAWQISDHFYPQYTDAMCDDPPTAARIVYLIKTQISGGWNQWNTYSSGAYQGLVTLAQAQNWINTHT